MAFDAYYDNVALLLHGNGANNSPVFTDNSPTPKTFTAYGGAKISTAQSKWGGSSMAFDGVDDYITAPDHAGFTLGSSNWTLEVFFWETSTDTARCMLGHRVTNFTPENAFGVTSYAGQLQLLMCSGTNVRFINALATHSTNAFHFLQIRCQYPVVEMYIDNVFQGTTTLPGALNNPAYPFVVGAALTSGGTPDSGYGFWHGYLQDIRLTPGIARAIALPTEAFANFAIPPIDVHVWVPLPAPALHVLCDFSGRVGDVVTRYVMNLAPGNERVPISSWQATLRSGGSSYVQCVVPACLDWVASIQAATEFVIYRQAVTSAGVIEYEMARSPIEQRQFDRGPARYTCTLSGYADGFAESLDPPAVYDRTLAGVRSISSGSGGWRVRCAVDWLLRPGHRAFVDGQPFVVAYINYYSPSGFDSYMDVGSAN